MSSAIGAVDKIHETLSNPKGGIEGMVNALLANCQDRRLRLDWQCDHCIVVVDEQPPFEVAMRQSVFRAILARVGYLCNQESPDSVSVYGGAGTAYIGEYNFQFRHFIREYTGKKATYPNALCRSLMPRWTTGLAAATNSA